MRLTAGLDDLFATRSHVRVLRALDGLPEGLTVSGRDIARRAGVSHPTAQSVLGSLDRQGVVIVGRSPRGAFFRLDPAHVLVPMIRTLFARERVLAGELERDLVHALTRIGDIESAYIFGSAARGDMRVDSDIDVAVVSRADVPEQSAELDKITQRFGNQVNVIRLKGGRGAGLKARIAKEGRQLRLPARTRRRSDR